MNIREQDLALTRARLRLGRQLRAQRQLIIEQIKPSSGEFPRSVTMRLLLWRPELTLRLVVGVVATLRRGRRSAPSPRTAVAAIGNPATGPDPQGSPPRR